jgi:hypothetical protein
MRIVCDSNKNTVTAYINGNVVAVHSTNLPVDATPLKMGITATVLATAAAQKRILIDHMDLTHTA